MLQTSFTPGDYSLGKQSNHTLLTNVDVARALVHSVFVVITLTTLILCCVWNCRRQWLQQKFLRSLKYSSEARTLFSLALMVIYIFAETETVLSTVKGSNWKPEAHVANSLALCGTASCLLICALSLEVVSAFFHFILFLYWSFCATLEIFRLIYHLEESSPHLASSDVRVLFSCCLLFFYASLVILEAVVLLYKVSEIFHC